jgi:ankyrin repeat protein
MKAQQINSLKAAMTILLLVSLFAITSCKSKEEKAQEEGSLNTPQASVRPPQIDIHTAVVTDNLKAVQQHIAAGSNLNEKDPFGGSSPLISAGVFGKTEIARALVDAGADLNFQNNDGSTALHTAAFFCRPEIVKMLLDKGADKTLKNKFGATAYESVAAPFVQVKDAYDMMGKILGPMGLKLDYTYIEKTRPEIAAMVK